MSCTNRIKEEILELKAERRAIILAHSYQNEEVQDIADFVGDSFALSRISAENDSSVIVFCGVHFMAESAYILSPQKTVLLPVPEAGCPMADMAEVEDVLEWKEKYPQAAVVSYVNSSAAVKAVSDICCTRQMLSMLLNPLTRRNNLYPIRISGVTSQAGYRETIHLWPGYCRTHHRVTPEEVLRVKELHPEAEILIHPECRPEVVALAIL